MEALDNLEVVITSFLGVGSPGLLLICAIILIFTLGLALGVFVRVVPPSPPANMRFTTFWSAIRDDRHGIVKNDSIIWMVGEDIDVTRMVIRQCYITLADRVLSSTATTRPVPTVALVLGIKGIGKSVFLNYLMVRIVEKHRAEQLPDPVIIFASNEHRVLFNSTGAFTTARDFFDADYLLIDSVDYASFSGIRKLAIEVSSNNPSHYTSFRDRLVEAAHGVRVNMPPWTYDELLLVNPVSATFTEEEAMFLFEVFGGCVRHFKRRSDVLESANDFVQRHALWYFGDHIKNTYSATWNWAMQEIRDRISKKMRIGTGGMTPDTVQISSLFWNDHINLSETEFTAGFTTHFMKLFAGYLCEEKEALLWNALRGVFGASGEGVAFESVGHKKLTTTNATYTAVNLKKGMRHDNRAKSFAKSFFDLPRWRIRKVEDIASLPDDHYGLPLFSNFPVVDAIIQPNILLQFTVAATHGNASDETWYEQIRAGLRGDKSSHKMIFIIKEENVGKFVHVGTPPDLQCYYMISTPLQDKNKRKAPAYMLDAVHDVNIPVKNSFEHAALQHARECLCLFVPYCRRRTIMHMTDPGSDSSALLRAILLSVGIMVIRVEVSSSDGQ
eukprot:gene23392-28384_t